VKIAGGVLGLPGDSEHADEEQSDDVETMVVTRWSFASCNGEAMRLELKCGTDKMHTTMRGHSGS
jgi:hypothetical protein